MSFIDELKRRNVIRVGIAYAVGAWLLAQAADLVLDVMGAPDIILRSLVAILALGFIPAVIFAWAFEITPEGIKKEKDVNREQSITGQTAKKLDIATMVLVIGAVVLLAVDRMLPEHDAGRDAGGSEAADVPSVGRERGSLPQQNEITETRSIAVLPFVDMSPAKDNEYFTDGLTEELLNILAQIKSLQVAGRTSSFAFKGKTEDLRDIGEKLNVNTLLEGSVRKDDQRQKIRVTVQLINVEDGYHIWSDTYDRDLEDIFAIQEDIARRVADALKINLLGEEAAEIADHSRTGMNAYDLYLKGLQELNLYTFDSLREAEKLFQESLEIDPDYQPTKLALVRAWLDLSNTGALPSDVAVQKARPMLGEILQGDPENSNALTYQALIHTMDDDYQAARDSFRLALESNPRNALALMEFGSFLIRRGNMEDGLELLESASRIEPYDIKVQWERCVTPAFMGDVAATHRECRRIGEIQPGNPMEFYGQSYVYLFLGDFSEYLYWQQKGVEADPADPELTTGMALAWLDLGNVEQAEEWLQRAGEIDPDHPTVIAARLELLESREQYQQALELAEQAQEMNLPDRQGSADVIVRVIANDAVRKQDYDRALKALRQRLPERLESPLDTENVFASFTLASMAMVLKLQDPNSDLAQAMLNRADELNRQSPDRHIPFDKPFRQAMIESARGDKKAALAALRTAFDKGWRWDWQSWMYHDFQFQPLHDEPEFRELAVLLENEMERERNEAIERLALVP